MSNSVKLIEFFFERTEDPTLFRCRNAKCGDRTYKQRSGSGYTNLRNHLRTCIGPNFEDVYKSSSGQRTLEQLGLTNRRDREVHDLIDWIVSRNQPFSEVDHEVTRRVLRSERICSKTIRKYILNLVPIVEKNIAKELPAHLALIFDGWTAARTHYVGVLLAYSSSNGYKESLIALAPLPQEDDLGAEQYASLLEDILPLYGKDLTNVVALIGDNCSVNKKLSSLVDIPLIGCASHKLNLAIEQWIGREKGLSDSLQVVHNLMVKLRTIKNAAKLRELTHLGATGPIETRWSGKFEMLRRYFRIEEHIKALEDFDGDVPSRSQIRILQEAMTHFSRFQSITVNLQADEITLSQVRFYFESICEDYPDMLTHLSPTANIVQSPIFEQGLCKILDGREQSLSPTEKQAVKHLRCGTVGHEESDCEGLSYFEQLEKKRRRVSVNQHRYINCSFIPPTSNTVERLFSRCKHVLTDWRKSMSPIMFEAVMFLKLNREFWDVKEVAAAMKIQTPSEVEGKDGDMFYDRL